MHLQLTAAASVALGAIVCLTQANPDNAPSTLSTVHRRRFPHQEGQHTHVPADPERASSSVQVSILPVPSPTTPAFPHLDVTKDQNIAPVPTFSLPTTSSPLPWIPTIIPYQDKKNPNIAPVPILTAMPSIITSVRSSASAGTSTSFPSVSGSLSPSVRLSASTSAAPSASAPTPVGQRSNVVAYLNEDGSPANWKAYAENVPYPVGNPTYLEGEEVDEDDDIDDGWDGKGFGNRIAKFKDIMRFKYGGPNVDMDQDGIAYRGKISYPEVDIINFSQLNAEAAAAGGDPNEAHRECVYDCVMEHCKPVCETKWYVYMMLTRWCRRGANFDATYQELLSMVLYSCLP